jgi:hypothetical protein
MPKAQQSKKVGLRMWNNIVYDRGGLALFSTSQRVFKGFVRSLLAIGRG